ncbi:MAG: glycosyltransferase family 39 protein [Candidatus Omnitrophota bacterium]|nr:glycosyltransferase family 39 protein [Candidatus Omnitrophota bacterium]MDZ4242347.1 glycosyltransferase family 39 protein [Candidatus Omnitrophota bacterium]
MLSRKSLLILGGILVVALATRMTALQRDFFNEDEATIALIADVIVDGGVPYRDVVDQQLPLAHYGYAMIFLLAGKNNMGAVHVALALLIALECLVIYILGRYAFRERVGLLAALFFAVFSWAGTPTDMWAAHTEWSLILFSMAGWGLLLKSAREKRPGWFFFSGISFGLAFLCKQVAVFDAAALGALLLLGPPVGRSWKERGRDAVLFGSGFAVPVFACFSYFWMRGAFQEFWMCAFEYNARFYVNEFTVLQRCLWMPVHTFIFFYLKPLLGFLTLLGLRTVLGGRAAKKREAPLSGVMLGVWFLGSFVAAGYTGRGFQYYFIQLLPQAVLLSALGLDGLMESGRAFFASRGKRLSLAWPALMIALVSAGIVYSLAATWGVYLRDYHQGDRELKSVANYIKQKTLPSQAIYVWGFHPEIYVLSDRRPATRFTISNFLTGMMPWANIQPDKDTAYAIMPGAWKIFLRELERDQPAYILDTSPAQFRSYGKYPMSKYPPLADFVRGRYELDPEFYYNSIENAVRLYRRVPGALP